MKNVFLINPIQYFDELCDMVRGIPDHYITNNYEQVKGMIRDNEVKKLCIVFGATNYSAGHIIDSIDGQKASEEFHKINPELHILIISGRSSIGGSENFYPVINKNEIYLEVDDYPNFPDIINQFFIAGLTHSDIPVRASINRELSLF